MNKEQNTTVWEKMARFSLDMLCTFNQDGFFTHVSHASFRILGYTSEELVGKHYSEFIHPSDLNEFQSILTKVLAGFDHSSFENRFIHKAGKIVPILWSSSWSEEEQTFYNVAQEISEYKKKQVQDEVTEQRYKTLFENNPDIIFLESKEGLIIEVNQSFSEAVGIPKEEMINKRASSFLSPETPLVSEMSLKEALSGRTQRFDTEIKTSSGERKVFDLIKSPIKAQGEVVAIQTVGKDITQIVRAYDTIQQQANNLSTVFESMTDAFFMLDKDWHFTYFNKEAQKLLQLDREKHLNKNIVELFPDFVDTEAYTQLLHSIETKQAVHFNAHYKQLDLWLRVKAFPSDRGLSIYFDDITEQVKAQKELERLSLVASKTQHGVVITDASGLTEWINEGFTHLTGYTPEEMIGQKPGSILQGPETDPATVEYIRQMLKKQVFFNTNIINYKKSGEKAWIAMDITPIFNKAGNLTNYIGIQKDVTERVKTQQELKKLSLVASNTTNGVIITDSKHNIEWVNKGFSKITGYSFEEVFGRDPGQFLVHDNTDISLYSQQREKIFQGEAINFELLNKRKDGSDVWVSVQTNPILDDKGNIEGFVSIQTDITELVRFQQELKKLSLVASNTTNGVLITSTERKIEWVNEGFTKLTGYSFEEAVGQFPFELLHSEQTNAECYQPIHDQILQGEPTSFEIQNRKKDGQDFWVSVQINPVFNDKGELERYIVIQTDITERVKFQQELEKLSLVASKTTNSVIISDKDDLIEWVNDSFTRLTGYTYSEVVGKKATSLLWGEETDTGTAKRFLYKLGQNLPFREELLVYDKAGQKRWFEVEVTPVLDANGEVIRRIRIQTDITSRIEAQQQLEKLSLVASKTNNGVLMADKNWNIEWVNIGFTKLMGYSLEETLGRKPSELLRKNKASLKSFQSLENKLLAGESISFEKSDLNKEGKKMWFLAEISPIFNAEGELIRFIEVLTDITALKESEEELAAITKDLYTQNTDLQQFTYIVSHNLRAPVANTMGLVDILVSSDKNSPEFDASLAYLQDTVLRLDTVLKDINEILSVRDSKGNVEREMVNLYLVLQQAKATLKEPLENAGAQVLVEIADDFEFMASKAYLFSIFYNLLSNAVKYRAEERSLIIKIKIFKSADKGIFISFSDNGSGFDVNKEKNNLFKMYKRFHTIKEGRGMGLFLIKNHVEALGGHIEVNSQIGTGTRFLIYLPRI